MSQAQELQAKKWIAIIGRGVSGIACMWGLRDADYEVHLFEAEPRLGGHANTTLFEGNRLSIPVDTGFIAMNEEAYRKSEKILFMICDPSLAHRR